ncbi:MAG TPA: T9SS type A sorting domain-containing protein, partial [Bacteroidota bacterium]|nr:T9SS type A sorting domain-containing protein [Bacteroidota bacterium]
VKFEYGLTTSYGNQVTATQSPLNGTTVTAVSAAISGLTPNTVYHYRMVATSIGGITTGPDSTFATWTVAPAIVTQYVDSVSSVSAKFEGSVNANNATTAVKFEYGLTASYGNQVTAAQSPVNGAMITVVNAAINGLTPNTVYHYRIVATNIGGTTNGADSTFSTEVVVPVATTLSTDTISPTHATVHGSVNANNATTTVKFEYGLTASYGNQVTAAQSPVNGTAPTAVSAQITGLVPNTTYHYRVSATNVAGTAVGADSTFTVPPVKVAVDILSMWNLISIPVNIGNDTVSNVFPTRISNSFAYNGSSYVIKNKLTVGIGYWLKFSSAKTDTLSGSPISSDTITVAEGWNLIGSLSSRIAANSIISDPPAITTSQFFGYNGSYKTSDTLYPGKGYWIKVNQSGTIVLSTGSSASLAKNVSISRIKIIPTAELPPPPPEDGISKELPKEFALEQNYPNPFNPTTTLRYALPTDSKVTLKIYNVLGQFVATLVNGVMSTGYQSAQWNASNVASGIYFYRIEATSISDPTEMFTQVRKMVLMK